MTRWRLVPGALVVAACTTGSGGRTDLGGRIEEDAAAGGTDAGSDARLYEGPLRCPPGLPGAELVLIPDAPRPFCIDAREVRQGEYVEFLDAVADDPPEQPAQCALNTRLDPVLRPYDNDSPSYNGLCFPDSYDPDVSPERVMACADWCDAAAYCAWAGKRLCGAMGAAPDASAADGGAEPLTPMQSEWLFACTLGGRQDYPYGDTANPTLCVGAGSDLEIQRARLGSETCVGSEAPYSAIRDMVGSVAEWTAECRNEHRCSARGAPGASSDEVESCATGGGHSSATLTNPTVGIRCCADAEGTP